MSEAAISEAIQAEQIFMQSDVERWQYEQREKALRDYISEINAARRTSHAEGLEEGLAQGRTEGTEQALLQSLRHLMNELSLPAERAMDVLHIPPSERDHYTHLLKQ